MNKKIVPTAIHIEKNGDIIITWNDGISSLFKSLDLRDACRCASCRNEFTGEKVLDRSNIRSDIYPEDLQTVGNYAMQITWNDGHRDGIYTWELLRGMDPKCPEPAQP